MSTPPAIFSFSAQDVAPQREAPHVREGRTSRPYDDTYKGANLRFSVRNGVVQLQRTKTTTEKNIATGLKVLGYLLLSLLIIGIIVLCILAIIASGKDSGRSSGDCGSHNHHSSMIICCDIPSCCDDPSVPQESWSTVGSVQLEVKDEHGNHLPISDQNLENALNRLKPTQALQMLKQLQNQQEKGGIQYAVYPQRG